MTHLITAPGLLGWVIIGGLAAATGLSTWLVQTARHHRYQPHHAGLHEPATKALPAGSMCLEDELSYRENIVLPPSDSEWTARLLRDLHDAPTVLDDLGPGAGNPVAPGYKSHLTSGPIDDAAKVDSPVPAPPSPGKMAADFPRAAAAALGEPEPSGATAPPAAGYFERRAPDGSWFPITAEEARAADWGQPSMVASAFAFDILLPVEQMAADERLAHTFDRLPVITGETVETWAARLRAEIAEWRNEPWAVNIP